MKKSLLALAVIGAFAGAANAQSSVTLYGLVDTYVESYKAGTISNTRLSAGGSTAGRMIGANVTIGAGPVNIVAAYHRENATAATVATLDNKSVYSIGANSKFGDFSPVFNYFNQTTNNVTAADSKIKGWSVGSGWGIGPWAAQLQYGQVKNDVVTSANEKFILVGGDYIFSKRTNLYLRYAEVKDKGGTNSAGDYLAMGQDLAADTKNRTIALGVRHRF